MSYIKHLKETDWTELNGSLGHNSQFFNPEFCSGSDHNSVLHRYSFNSKNDEPLLIFQFLIGGTDKIHADCRFLYNPYSTVAPTKNYLKKTLREQERIFIEASYAMGSCLLKTVSSFTFYLSPIFKDIRGLSFLKFDQKLKLESEIFYTTYVELGGSAKSFYEGLPKKKRYEVRNNRYVLAQANVNDFLFEYERMFKSKGIEVSNKALDAVRGICVSGETRGSVAMIKGSVADGVATHFAVFLIDKLDAYYMFGVSKAASASGSGFSFMVSCFDYLREKGVRCVDMMGVNSPNRGYFKQSFGNASIAYHLVRIRNQL